MTAVNQHIILPFNHLDDAIYSPTYNTFVLDASNDKIVMVCQMPEDATITKIGFRISARTGTPPTYRASLRGVGSTGLDDGTVKGSGACYVDFTPPASTAWNAIMTWQTLGASYSAVRGELIALVIEYQTGTINASNCSTFTRSITGAYGGSALPYDYTVNAGGAASRSQEGIILFNVIASSTRVYQHPPFQTFSNTAYSSNSTPDERGVTFILPTSYGASYKIVGARVLGGITPATGKLFTMNLYDTNNSTVLQSRQFDGDQFRSVTSSSRVVDLYFDETTLSTLTTGSRYSLTLRQDDLTSSAEFFTFVFDSTTTMAGLPFGTTWYYCHLTDGGSYTATDTTTLPRIGLILADLTPPAAGGGGGSYGY